MDARAMVAWVVQAAALSGVVVREAVVPQAMAEVMAVARAVEVASVTSEEAG
jgi:hypothetical protein